MGGVGRLLFVAAALCVAGLAVAQTPDEKALIELARSAVVAEVTGKKLSKSDRKSPPKPVFVTIESKGQVIGCRGTLEVRSASLEEEIVLAARSAAAHDPRYKPLSPADLKSFLVT